MTILHLTTFLQGGAGRAIVDLAIAQAQLGHHVTVVSSRTGVPGYGNYSGHLARLSEAGIHVVLEDSLFVREHAATVGAAGALCYLGDGRRAPDVIHAHAAMPGVAALMLAGCWRRPIALVQTMHGWGIAKTTLQAATDVGVMNLMDVVVTPSQSSRATLVAQGVNPSRVRVVPYGVDPGLEEFHPRDTDLAAEIWERRRRGAFVIACVGTVGLRKNQRLLIEAIARLGAPGATFTVFLGDGETAQLQQIAEAAGVGEDVRIHGYTPGARRLAREADVLVLPSRSEGQPVSILEAFCDRTLVVAADIPELTELVSHTRTGLVFAANEATSLAEAIVSAKTLATGERRAIVDRARLRYEARFSLQAMIDGYLSIYGAQAGRKSVMRRAG